MITTITNQGNYDKDSANSITGLAVDILDLAKSPSATDALVKPHESATFAELPPGDLWVFGYGSLMWRPGFEFIEAVQAKVFGYHRSLCVASWVHRGTPKKPGLVLGLDRGGSCAGMAFRVKEEHKDQVAHYLYSRELATLAYQARLINIHFDNNVKATALSFVVNRHHEQYIKNKPIDELASIVQTAKGINGKSSDYLFSTLAHLRQLNIQDRSLEALATKLKEQA